jgi:hypothetical protein
LYISLNKKHFKKQYTSHYQSEYKISTYPEKKNHVNIMLF